jgi:hypothetical protein
MEIATTMVFEKCGHDSAYKLVVVTESMTIAIKVNSIIGSVASNSVAFTFKFAAGFVLYIGASCHS